MARVGIVGFGFMGQMHYKCWKGIEGAQVAAVCDVNPNIEEDTKKAVGNIGDTDEPIDFGSFELYTRCSRTPNWMRFRSRCRLIYTPTAR
ncbi:MAG: hypothetical protein ACYS19_17265 [Planctomycetota bacterium]